jgi:prefoldin subunit 5
MNDTNIHINIEQNIFQQLNLLQQNFTRLEQEVKQIGEVSKGSFDTLKDKIKGISLQSITESLDRVGQPPP